MRDEGSGFVLGLRWFHCVSVTASAACPVYRLLSTVYLVFTALLALALRLIHRSLDLVRAARNHFGHRSHHAPRDGPSRGA